MLQFPCPLLLQKVPVRPAVKRYWARVFLLLASLTISTILLVVIVANLLGLGAFSNKMEFLTVKDVIKSYCALDVLIVMSLLRTSASLHWEENGISTISSALSVYRRFQMAHILKRIRDLIVRAVSPVLLHLVVQVATNQSGENARTHWVKHGIQNILCASFVRKLLQAAFMSLLVSRIATFITINKLVRYVLVVLKPSLESVSMHSIKSGIRNTLFAPFV